MELIQKPSKVSLRSRSGEHEADSANGRFARPVVEEDGICDAKWSDQAVMTDIKSRIDSYTSGVTLLFHVFDDQIFKHMESLINRHKDPKMRCTHSKLIQ